MPLTLRRSAMRVMMAFTAPCRCCRLPPILSLMEITGIVGASVGAAVVAVGVTFAEEASVAMAEGAGVTSAEGAGVAIAEGAPVKSNENENEKENEPEDAAANPSSFGSQSCGSGKSPDISLARFPWFDLAAF